MKKLSFLLAVALIGLFVLTDFSTDARSTTFAERFSAENLQTQGTTGTYNFDRAHTSIGFYVKHMGLVDVPGHFRDFNGTINYNTDVAKSSVEFTAKMTSIDTGVGKRDEHLRNPDFFEVEKFPEMTFKSTKIEKQGNQWMITGNLTMKDVTKQISFPFNIAGFLPGERGTRMGATAETTINRKEFNVNYDPKLPSGSPQLSHDVRVVLNIEAIMPTPTKTTAE